MTAEIHALSGAYALDALSEAERAEFDQHLATCAACRDEVDSLRATAARLAETSATPPSPSVRDAVLSGITQIRPLPPKTVSTSSTGDGPGPLPPTPTPVEPVETSATGDGPGPLPPSPTPLEPVETSATGDGPGPLPPSPTPVEPVETSSERTGVVVPLRRRWISGLVAAAAVVATLGAGAVVWHPWEETSQVSATDRVVSAPDATRTTKKVGHADVTLVRSASLGQAVVLTDDLALPPPGLVYELWLQNEAGQLVPAGLLPLTTSQEFLLSGDAGSATAAGITLEPEGGSDQPTTTPLALFPFVAAT